MAFSVESASDVSRQNTGNRRCVMPVYALIDGRSLTARRIREAARRIRAQVGDIDRRLTHAEADLLLHTARMQVLAEVATTRSLLGEVTPVDATRANTAAKRQLKDLLAALTPKPAEPLSLQEYLANKHGVGS